MIQPTAEYADRPILILYDHIILRNMRPDWLLKEHFSSHVVFLREMTKHSLI